MERRRQRKNVRGEEERRMRRREGEGEEGRGEEGKDEHILYCALFIFFYFYSSISSSYNDLMPQFLRYIKVLCALYPYYRGAVPSLTMTTPTHPRQVSPTSRVRQNESVLESSRQRRAATIAFFSGRGREGGGHVRANSHESPVDIVNEIERDHSMTASLSDVTSSFNVGSDPLEQLDSVWISLSSWFELLQNEIAKLPEVSLPLPPPTSVKDKLPPVKQVHCTCTS